MAQDITKRSSAIDRRTTRLVGYLASQRRRKRIEEIFAWLKMVGLLRNRRHRGVVRVSWMFTFGLAVYNLVLIRATDVNLGQRLLHRLAEVQGRRASVLLPAVNVPLRQR